MKAVLKNAWGYQGNNMELPVGNVETAIPFYEQVIGSGLNPAAMSRTPLRFLNVTG